MTTTVLNTKLSEFENSIPNTSGLVTTTVLSIKISEVENKTPKHEKYITAPEFNKLTARNFTERLKQANLVNKTDVEEMLTSFNSKITSNKTKYLEVQKILNGLITNDHNFFFCRMYFTRNNRSQNTFVYQPILDTFEFKKDKGTDYVLS